MLSCVLWISSDINSFVKGASGKFYLFQIQGGACDVVVNIGNRRSRHIGPQLRCTYVILTLKIDSEQLADPNLSRSPRSKPLLRNIDMCKARARRSNARNIQLHLCWCNHKRVIGFSNNRIMKWGVIIWATSRENMSSGLRPGKTQTHAQPQRLAWVLKFWI